MYKHILKHIKTIFKNLLLKLLHFRIILDLLFRTILDLDEDNAEFSVFPTINILNVCYNKQN